MAFVRLAFFPGATRGHFDALARAMTPEHAPQGRLLFAAGPVPGGWQVVQVWTSRELLADFNDAHFLPALAALGASAFPAPPVVTDFESSVLEVAAADEFSGRRGSTPAQPMPEEQP